MRWGGEGRLQAQAAGSLSLGGGLGRKCPARSLVSAAVSRIAITASNAAAAQPATHTSLLLGRRPNEEAPPPPPPAAAPPPGHRPGGVQCDAGSAGAGPQRRYRPPRRRRRALPNRLSPAGPAPCAQTAPPPRAARPPASAPPPRPRWCPPPGCLSSSSWCVRALCEQAGTVRALLPPPPSASTHVGRASPPVLPRRPTTMR